MTLRTVVAVRFAGVRLLAGLPATVLFAAEFPEDFLAAGFFATGLLVVAFLAVVFFATAFLAAGLFAAVFFTTAFFTDCFFVAFPRTGPAAALAPGFLAVDFTAAPLRTVFFAGLRAAAFPAVRFAAAFFVARFVAMSPPWLQVGDSGYPRSGLC